MSKLDELMRENSELREQNAYLIRENEEYQKRITQYVDLLGKKDILIIRLEKEIDHLKSLPDVKTYFLMMHTMEKIKKH